MLLSIDGCKETLGMVGHFFYTMSFDVLCSIESPLISCSVNINTKRKVIMSKINTKKKTLKKNSNLKTFMKYKENPFITY